MAGREEKDGEEKEQRRTCISSRYSRSIIQQYIIIVHQNKLETTSKARNAVCNMQFKRPKSQNKVHP